MQSLAEHIKAKRIEQRLTKVELAKILDSRPITLWTWERKGKQPAPRLMKNIIKWLGYVPPLGVDEKTLSGKLYLYRMINGLTQQQVASTLKIDRWFITKIENKQEIDHIYIQKVQDFISSVDLSKMYNSTV